jgi:hypothetical protein
MIVLYFNAPGATEAELHWPSFFVPAGCLDCLIEDERAFRILCSGEPFTVTFEDATEGAYLAELVAALLKQRQAPALH